MTCEAKKFNKVFFANQNTKYFFSRLMIRNFSLFLRQQTKKMLMLRFGGLLDILGCMGDLPIGYYTFVRIIITIGAVCIIVNEPVKDLNFWRVAFGRIAIRFISGSGSSVSSLIFSRVSFSFFTFTVIR